MKRISFLFCLLIAGNICMAQPKELPAELKAFVLNGYKMLDYIQCNLNDDQRIDAILILKVNGEDTIINEDPKRPFLLLIRQADGKLKMEKRNDNLVMCHHCGGMYGEPYAITKPEKKGFTISFYGGSNWRWGYDYSFAYNTSKNNWFLVNEYQQSYNAGDPEHLIKDCNIKDTESGEVPIEKFSSEIVETETNWKVISAKTFFFNCPEKGTRPRKGYLVKGDKVVANRVLKNFVEVDFENKKETYTSGYILKKDLQRIK